MGRVEDAGVDYGELRLALGRTVRALRYKEGFSQEGFAHRVGVHPTYLGGIERGERNVSLMNLTRLAGALGMPLSALIAEAEEVAERKRRG